MRPSSFRAACGALFAAQPLPLFAQESGETTLDPILVEATHPTNAADDAGSVVIDREAIERRNPQTLRDVFAGEAGVSVGGGIAAAQKVYVNGVEETQLSVSVDGARQNRKVFHHTGTNLIDPALLKAVRVDPGVAPADAGPGALGGSITYETVDVGDLLAPDRSFGAFGSGDAETNGSTIGGGAAAFGRSGGFEALAYTRRVVGDDYDDGDGQTVDGSGADLWSLLGKLAYQSPEGHRIELSGLQVQDNADRPFRANIGALPGRPDPLTREYDLTTRGAVLSYGLAAPRGLWDPTALVGWSESRIDVPDPYESEGATSGWNAKFENRFALGAGDSITVGTDFYADEAQYEDPLTPSLSEKATNAGVYAQARLRPIESISLSFGARGDAQNFEGVDGRDFDNAGVSGNAAIAWEAHEHVTLSAGWSDVWGGIQLQEPYIFNPGWDYSGIEPTRARNLTAGVAFDYAGFTAETGVFRTDFDDARDATYRGGPYLPLDFRSQGWRLSLGYGWGSGFVRGSFVDSEIKSGGRTIDSDTAQYFGTPLGQVFALEAGQEYRPWRLTFGGTVEAALDDDSLVSQGYGEQDGYTVLNLWVEHRPDALPGVAIRLTANNLFDELYADRATYGQEFEEVRPLYEPGRSVMLTARVEF